MMDSYDKSKNLIKKIENNIYNRLKAFENFKSLTIGFEEHRLSIYFDIIEK